jgi:hypothetical protein
VKKGTTHHQTDFIQKLEKKTNSSGETTEILYKKKKLSFGPGLKAASNEIAEVRSTFCDNMRKNIEDRFPKDTEDVASAFSVLCMRPLTFLSAEQRADYGVKELSILTNFYGQRAEKGGKVSEPLIQKEECMEEWSMAKETVLQNMYPRDSTKNLYKLLSDFHKDTFPNLLVLANLALIMPYQTADCERGFSFQNGIKTARRNRLQQDSLNSLMTIKCEGAPIQEHDFVAAAHLWKKKKERRLFNK